MKLRKYVSSIRSSLNAVNTDIFISDRYIVTMLQTINNKFLEQQLVKKSLISSPSLFTAIDCLEMKTIPIYECGIAKADCNISVSKCELPRIVENHFGMVIDYVGSIDGKNRYERLGSLRDLENILMVFPNRKLKKYYIIEGRKLYITDPNIEAIKFSAMFSDITFDFDSINTCDKKEGCPENPLDREFPTLPKLESDIIKYTVMEILQTKYQIKNEETSDQREKT